MKAWMQAPNVRGKAFLPAAPWPVKPCGSAIIIRLHARCLEGGGEGRQPSGQA